MSLFWTWFGFWGQRGVGFPVCFRLPLRFSLYSLFQTRHSCFASRILEARDSYLQFSGSVPLRSLAQGTQPFVGPLASPEMVSSRPELGVLTNLRFRDQSHFKAGMLHENFPVWQRLLADYSCAVDLLEILRDGVRVENFFIPFRGDFKGQFYHAQTPPSIHIKNAAICAQFADFISDTIVQWVASGVLSVWGEVGVVSPPHLVLPITIEPSKPRLCHDERFLNLWIRDLPFKLDHLADLPRYVLPGHFQTTFDDKSGYQHVRLHPSSETYFGLEWDYFFFVFRTLPFGWKASAYIYHNLGLVVSHAARSLGVPLSQYIDDRHVGQLFASPMRSVVLPSAQRAEAAAFILCYILIEAGYFINTDKSQHVPSTVVCFLGFLCDSMRQAFLIPRDKKAKFATLRESILSSSCVSLKTLQRFAGKVVSFSLAIPSCKLYVREVFHAIAQLTRSSKAAAKVQGRLRLDVAYWRFLDDWSDCLPWRSEQHCIVSLFCDASKRSWGGILFKDGRRIESRDYWMDVSDDINSLEAKALVRSLLAFRDHVRNSRVDIHTDNRTLKAALDNFGCKNSSVNDSVKEILELSRHLNLAIDVHYVPSRDNMADAPSRACSDLDCMLSDNAWNSVERRFGPHSFDLMALDGNCRRDRSGLMLPHYSPWPTPASKGVNAFAQPIPLEHNIYAFPPFVLLGPLLRYFLGQGFQGALTLVVPDLRPRRFWWALLQSVAVDRLLLGRKGDDAVLLFPSRSTHVWSVRRLQWDLWAYRCIF